MAGPDLARERIGHRSGRSSGPGNVGTIIRSADAVGLLAWFWDAALRGFVQPQDARSTMGSLFHLPVLEAIC